MSAYVYRALAIARKLNQNPDESLLNRSRSYLYKALESTPNEFLKAYILFSLSEGGEIESSLVESLAGIVDKQGVYGKALTGLVLLSAGNTEKSKGIFKKAISESGILNGKISQEGESIEKDTVETLSALLLLAVRLNEETISETISEELFSRRTEIGWKNSRDTGVAVLALSEKLQVFSEKITPISLRIKVNGKEFKQITIKASEILSGKAESNFNIPFLNRGENIVELIKEKGGSIYAIASLKYTDRSSSFSATEKGIKVKREYFSVTTEERDGKIKLSTKKTNSFKPGELVMVTIEIERAGKSDSYFMIDDPLLPGFSFVKKDTNYYTGEIAAEYESRQIYDDRAVFFIRGPLQKSTVRYFLRADMTGSYNSAPASASLMYYPEVRGSSASETLKVE
jgi:alpha-2-macroglobulin